MTKKDMVIVAAVVAVLIGAAIATYVVVQNTNEAALRSSDAGRALFGDNTPAYTDLLRNPVDLASYVGRPLIVFSWASWCPSCNTQLATLAALAAERSDVAILAINRAEPAPTVERYVAYTGLETNGSILFILDPEDHFYQSVGGYAMPETVVFNAEGAITTQLRGDVSIDALRAALEN